MFIFSLDLLNLGIACVENPIVLQFASAFSRSGIMMQFLIYYPPDPPSFASYPQNMLSP